MSGLRLGLPFFSPHRGHLIHKRDDLGDIVCMGSRDRDGQRDALGINKDVDLRASLAASRGIRPCFLAAAGCLRCRAVDQCARPVDLVRPVELSQENLVEFLKHPCSVPRLEPTKTGHPGAAPQLRGHLAPRDAGPPHEDNSGQDLAVLDGFAARLTVPPSTRLRQQRPDSLPQIVGDPL